MKILKIIHGYPPEYNAGSEIYSQKICRELSKNHETHVFSRQENPFKNDYVIDTFNDQEDINIIHHRINIPIIRHRYKYSHKIVDQKFYQLLNRIKPSIVHIGHLNHLSTTIVDEIIKFNVPIVYTLHDFWLICARGQFLQRNNEFNKLWSLCDGQENGKCALNCYSGYFSGLESEKKNELEYWTNWFYIRTNHMKEIIDKVDLFLAPARHLLNVYRSFYKLNQKKFKYLDYGFDIKKLKNRKRTIESDYVFGYIGTHTPQKGIDLLIHAFGKTKNLSVLKIWGKSKGDITPSLIECVKLLPEHKQKKIKWLGEYCNDSIVTEVFNNVDCIIVPSIWVENSPLVIHEAQQARVPIITADVGGMAEYTHHEINGLLFEHRNIDDLSIKMDKLSNNLALSTKLGQRGYISSKEGNIPCIKEHVSILKKTYLNLIAKKGVPRYEKKTWSMENNI